jgi:hypothetical protein
MKKISNEEKYSIRKKSDIRYHTSDIRHQTLNIIAQKRLKHNSCIYKEETGY